jgi:predicted TIM-barrel fold metal-dependent hydrolase
MAERLLADDCIHACVSKWDLAQHPTVRHAQDSIFDSLRRWTKTWSNQMHDPQLPVSATLAAMDQGEIAKSLISAWYAPRNVMSLNDEVAGFVAQAPERLIGVGSVDISRPMQAMREARRCVEEIGFKAIRVLPWLWEAAPTDRRFYPVYVACCELRVPFCTQIGHTGPLMPSDLRNPPVNAPSVRSDIRPAVAKSPTKCVNANSSTVDLGPPSTSSPTRGTFACCASDEPVARTSPKTVSRYSGSSR